MRLQFNGLVLIICSIESIISFFLLFSLLFHHGKSLTTSVTTSTAMTAIFEFYVQTREIPRDLSRRDKRRKSERGRERKREKGRTVHVVIGGSVSRGWTDSVQCVWSAWSTTVWVGTSRDKKLCSCLHCKLGISLRLHGT
jgi:hypothetical protein